MKIEELRIGNLISFRGKEIMKISLLDFNDLFSEDDDIKDYHSIPLTEEWLLKFGLSKEVYSIGVGLSGEIHINLKGSVFICDESDSNYAFEAECNHVHQLQNLYFALTGEELTLSK